MKIFDTFWSFSLHNGKPSKCFKHYCQFPIHAFWSPAWWSFIMQQYLDVEVYLYFKSFFETFHERFEVHTRVLWTLWAFPFHVMCLVTPFTNKTRHRRSELSTVARQICLVFSIKSQISQCMLVTRTQYNYICSNLNMHVTAWNKTFKSGLASSLLTAANISYYIFSCVKLL